jgi:hypothetical protein
VSRTARREPALAAAGWLVGVLVFFRDPVFSGFDTFTGDEGDARLVVFLHEHWWQVWHGDRPWRTPPMFHPTTDVLSYSDTYLLDQLLYTPLRLLGVEPFVAYQLCLIALTAVGYAAVTIMLRRHVGLALAPACLLAASVAFANNLYVDTGHGQMYAANVIPAVALLAVEAWRATTRWRPVAFGAAAGLLLGLLVWSTFYLGWFAILLGALAGLIALGLRLGAGEGVDTWHAIRARWRPIAAAATGFAIAMVGFVVTYWSPLTEARGRSYDEVKGLAPRPFDMLNVGRDNVVWGWAMRALVGSDDPRLEQLNRAVALTPVLLVTVGVSVVGLALGWWRGERSARAVAGLAAGLATLVVVVLPVQFGFGGAWSWLFRFVPGGDAIRVYGRIEVVNAFPACLAAGCWVAGWQHMRWRVPAGAVALGLCAVIALEQVNLTDNFRRLDRSEQLAMLDTVATPPPGCTSFDVVPVPARNPDHASIDAMLIAQRVGVPTVNGYSGWMPDGWSLVPGGDGYAAAVEAWVDQHGLRRGHCRLDLSTNRWSRT